MDIFLLISKRQLLYRSIKAEVGSLQEIIGPFSKIFEKTLSVRIDNREGLTQDAIALIVGKIYQAIDRKKPIMGVFFDLSVMK